MTPSATRANRCLPFVAFCIPSPSKTIWQSNKMHPTILKPSINVAAAHTHNPYSQYKEVYEQTKAYTTNHDCVGIFTGGGRELTQHPSTPSRHKRANEWEKKKQTKKNRSDGDRLITVLFYSIHYNYDNRCLISARLLTGPHDDHRQLFSAGAVCWTERASSRLIYICRFERSSADRPPKISSSFFPAHIRTEVVRPFSKTSHRRTARCPSRRGSHRVNYL